MNDCFFPFVVFFAGVIGFVKNFDHVINMLIMIEVMMLGVISVVFGWEDAGGLSSWVFLVILFVMVCESVLGISVMVAMSRSHGAEMVSSMILMEW